MWWHCNQCTPRGEKSQKPFWSTQPVSQKTIQTHRDMLPKTEQVLYRDTCLPAAETCVPMPETGNILPYTRGHVPRYMFLQCVPKCMGHLMHVIPASHFYLSFPFLSPVYCHSMIQESSCPRVLCIPLVHSALTQWWPFFIGALLILTTQRLTSWRLEPMATHQMPTPNAPLAKRSQYHSLRIVSPRFSGTSHMMSFSMQSSQLNKCRNVCQTYRQINTKQNWPWNLEHNIYHHETCSLPTFFLPSEMKTTKANTWQTL